jgi:two-component system, cell cycle sensor histidine kinase and response regulator CckA
VKVKTVGVFLQIAAVYQRAAILSQRATEIPLQPALMEAALAELHFVLEELQTSQEELCDQNEELIATRQLVEQERQRYQTLFEMAPDGYLVTDRQGKIYDANQAAGHLFFTSQQYLISKPLVVLINEADRPLFLKQLANLNAMPLTPLPDWEIALIPRQGETRSVAVTVAKIQGRQTDEDALLWLFRDITLHQQTKRKLQSDHDELEQRVAERTSELSHTAERLQQKVNEYHQAEQKIYEQAALIDIATDAIFVQDLDHRILFWSKGAERLYGWTATEVLGKRADELFCQEPLCQIELGFRETMERGFWQDELEQVTQTGKSLIVASRWTLVHYESGTPKSILVVNTDVTEKKQLEAQFYRAQRMESLGTLASGISHDLNNVFTPILGIAQLMLHKPETLKDRSPEMLQVIVDSTKRGADLIKQVLTFARGTPGQRVSLPAGQVLAEVVKVIEQVFPKSIKINYELPIQTLPLVEADSSQLHQILMNLCINARDAMPDGGILTIKAKECYLDETLRQMKSTAAAGDYVVITVTDTGSGISPEIIEQIFEPFFTTKEPGQGTGLGLSTVFSIAKNHSGFVEVGSKVGKGSQFRVYLPAIEGVVIEPVLPEMLPAGNQELVLIIDDEPTVRLSTKITLETHHYRTLLASSGAEAIALYTEHQSEIKATIVDMVMPNIDGLSTIQTLKSIDPQIIMMAVSGLPIYQQSALAAGAKVFVSKPYTAQDLLMPLHDLILNSN